jgi:2-polyprenyl-6-hydroxyphenyl methylase/3-demethylubiquinone-9 3-methyltransferase
MERRGDTVAISGDYQYKARTQGRAVQRFWHYEKERVIRKFSAPSPDEQVLDVGCGSGVVADLLASMGADVTGVDVNAEAIAFAEANYQRPNLRFRRALVEDLPYPAGSIDRIYCMEVIEHLYEPQVRNLLATFHRLIRPGGVLTLTTPNYRGFWPAIEIAMDRLRLAPPLAEHQHVTKFHRASLRRLLLETGWQIERLSTFCTFAPFVSALSWQAAEQCAALEDKADVAFGNLLLTVARRVGPSSGAPGRPA